MLLKPEYTPRILLKCIWSQVRSRIAFLITFQGMPIVFAPLSGYQDLLFISFWLSSFLLGHSKPLVFLNPLLSSFLEFLIPCNLCIPFSSPSKRMLITYPGLLFQLTICFKIFRWKTFDSVSLVLWPIHTPFWIHSLLFPCLELQN